MKTRRSTTNRVLLLNADWSPLAVLTLKRAVLLVLTDKATVLEEGDGQIRSSRMSIAAPSVIRLNYFVKVPYRSRTPLNRRAVLARDKGICQYCGKTADTIDHVQPRSRGGLHRWENVVASCRKDNSKKDSFTLAELGWSLPRQPYAPTGAFWLVIGLTRVDERWLPYLGIEDDALAHLPGVAQPA